MKIFDILNEGDKERALESFIKKIKNTAEWEGKEAEKIALSYK